MQAPYQQSYNEDASHSHRPLSHQEIANSHALNTLPNLRKILLDRANEDMQSSPPMYNLHDMPEQVQIHPSHRETLIERVNDEDARYHPQLGSHQSWHERTGVVPTTEREAGPEKPADPTSYAQPFMKFITENPTVYHAVDNVRQHLQHAGFQELSERESWDNLEHEGAYFVKRNNSSIIAFRVGNKYKPGNGASIIATHIDALATRLKPVSSLPTKEGYVQLGVAPYAGALNGTWWDRDLGIGGRVIVRDNKTHKITQRLVKLDYPIARIPTLAPHFGQAANLGGANKETEMVPIVGLDNSDLPSTVLPQRDITSSSNVRSFTSTQPPRLVSAISKALPLHSQEEIINWDLELFDTQPAQLGGIDKDLIFAPRVDDKLCSWCAIEALTSASATQSPNTLNVVACFDDEEIGSRLRQGAHSNFLPETLSRIASVFCGAGGASAETIGKQKSVKQFDLGNLPREVSGWLKPILKTLAIPCPGSLLIIRVLAQVAPTPIASLSPPTSPTLSIPTF